MKDAASVKIHSAKWETDIQSLLPENATANVMVTMEWYHNLIFAQIWCLPNGRAITES